LFQGVCAEKLRYTFPAFTIGEAAAATVVTASGADWSFSFRSNPSRVNLCALPLAGHADYTEPGDRLALNGEGQFVSFGHELSCAAVGEMVGFIEERYPEREAIDLWFPHAASAELCRQAETRLNLTGKVAYDVFPRYGNLVSASVPASLHLTIADGRLRRGNRIVLCPASAGMAFALVDLVY
jgi:3-oxoacyl-[acyl-carrier-protein] synthase III